MPLTPGQQQVVEHRTGPCRVVGGFGCGKTTVLAARADRLRAEGRRPLLLHPRDFVAFAVDLLARHGPPVGLISPTEQARLVRDLLGAADPITATATNVAPTITAFQASFLGDEELRVHAEAADQLDRAEELIALTERYLDVLQRRGLVDRGGALVQASLALRRPEVLEAERAAFDELLVDDFQLATFGMHRLVGQLVGPGGALTVAGNVDAAVSDEAFASATHLERFDRRFGAALDVTLDHDHRPAATVERLTVDGNGDDDMRSATDAAVGSAPAGPGGVAVVAREAAGDAVGREWARVVVPDVTEGRWPAPLPIPSWFDDELFHGPDVPSEDERGRRWLADERRRFLVATSRATTSLVVLCGPSPSPLVRELAP